MANKQNNYAWTWTIVIVLGIWGYSWASGAHTESTTETIQCQQYTQNDDLLYVGQSRLVGLCLNGSRTKVEKYSNWDNKDLGQVSDDVTLQPQNQIKYIGTKLNPIYTPSYTTPYATNNYGGTLCADGTVSASTGRGTCSYHCGEAALHPEGCKY